MGLSETFGFEELWLRRLIKVVEEHPGLFSPDKISDAQYLLGGLGNRQVLALRDWARGMGLIVEKGRGHIVLSAFGRLLLDYDPQLDELGSMWAIHHGLCMRSDDIWFYAYYANHVRCGSITRGELKTRLLHERKMSDSVVEKKCLTPLLHTMKKTKLGTECGLMAKVDEATYERKPPDESRLHPAVLAYMVCDWAYSQDRQTASLTELSQEGGSGCQLQLETTVFSRMLRRVQDRYRKRVLWISETAGLNSVTFDRRISPLCLLRAYYLEHVEECSPLESLDKAIQQAG